MSQASKKGIKGGPLTLSNPLSLLVPKATDAKSSPVHKYQTNNHPNMRVHLSFFSALSLLVALFLATSIATTSVDATTTVDAQDASRGITQVSDAVNALTVRALAVKSAFRNSIFPVSLFAIHSECSGCPDCSQPLLPPSLPHPIAPTDTP